MRGKTTIANGETGSICTVTCENICKWQIRKQIGKKCKRSPGRIPYFRPRTHPAFSSFLYLQHDVSCLALPTIHSSLLLIVIYGGPLSYSSLVESLTYVMMCQQPIVKRNLVTFSQIKFSITSI